MGVISNNSNQIQKINQEFEEREAISNARKWGFSYVDLAKFTPNLDVLKFISEKQCRDAQVFPLSKKGKKLMIASVNPKTEKIEKLANELKKQKYEPEFLVCSSSALKNALSWYQSDFMQKKVIEKKSTFKENSDENLKNKIHSIAQLKEKVSNLPAETALGEIEIAAIDAKASDIHFQPQENGSVLRFRIDGILHDIFDMDKEVTKKIITRIKYEAGMRSNISNIPQDGHMSFMANGRKIDLRISTLPTPVGESIVARILDSERGIQSFTELGFSLHAKDKILASLREKKGLVLVTGPTGSGKTTTLYSMLAELNSPDKKLVTLEDPIEYHLEGVSQSQVDENKEYNFDNGLKALLRHDPDIILVGEIRTLKTAKLASEAALTGHTVLSSLHTNSAIGAITRLRNLGLENFNIAPTLNAVFAQRLIRKVCPFCAEETDLSNNPKVLKALERIKMVFPDFKISSKIKKAIGCMKCSDTGYSGRTAVCESFLITDEVRKMILSQKSEIEILEYLRQQTDFLTLFEDGLLKVLNGETTLEEIGRVTG